MGAFGPLRGTGRGVAECAALFSAQLRHGALLAVGGRREACAVGGNDRAVWPFVRSPGKPVRKNRLSVFGEVPVEMENLTVFSVKVVVMIL